MKACLSFQMEYLAAMDAQLADVFSDGESQPYFHVENLTTMAAQLADIATIMACQYFTCSYCCTHDIHVQYVTFLRFSHICTKCCLLARATFSQAGDSGETVLTCSFMMRLNTIHNALFRA